jgi:integrase
MRGRPSLPLGKHGAVWMGRNGKAHVAYCYYRDMDGVTRRVKASAATAQGARNKLQERLDSRSVSGAGDITADSTVQQLAVAWQESLHVHALGKEDGSVGQSTKDDYVRHTKNHILPALGQLRLRELSVGRIEAFLATKRDKPSIARNCRTILGMMCGMAARLDAMEANIVRDTTTVKTTRTVKAMTVQDIEAFRAHISTWAGDNPERAYVVDITDLFIATGLRPGELLGLQWSDIDFKNRTLTVTGTLKQDSVNGFHRKPTPKSESGNRTLALPEFVWPMLARRKLVADSDKVFPGRGDVWRRPANFHTTWKAARGEKWATVRQKDFRTAVATMIQRESGSLAAAGQLGHSSAAVTEKYYIERQKQTQDNSAILGRINQG